MSEFTIMTSMLMFEPGIIPITVAMFMIMGVRVKYTACAITISAIVITHRFE